MGLFTPFANRSLTAQLALFRSLSLDVAKARLRMEPRTVPTTAFSGAPSEVDHAFFAHLAAREIGLRAQAPLMAGPITDIEFTNDERLFLHRLAEAPALAPLLTFRSESKRLFETGLITALRKRFSRPHGFTLADGAGTGLAFQRAVDWARGAWHLGNLVVETYRETPDGTSEPKDRIPFPEWIGYPRFFQLVDDVPWLATSCLAKSGIARVVHVELADSAFATGVSHMHRPSRGRLAEWLGPQGFASVLSTARNEQVAKDVLLTLAYMVERGTTETPSGGFAEFLDGLQPTNAIVPTGFTPDLLVAIIRAFQESAATFISRWATTTERVYRWYRSLHTAVIPAADLANIRRHLAEYHHEIHGQIQTGPTFDRAAAIRAVDRVWREYGKKITTERLTDWLVIHGQLDPTHRQAYHQLVEQYLRTHPGRGRWLRGLVFGKYTEREITTALEDEYLMPPPAMELQISTESASHQTGDVINIAAAKPRWQRRPKAPLFHADPDGNGGAAA